MMQHLASNTHKQWITLETADDVAFAARDEIKLAARKAIDDHGEFRIVLAGGSTPEQVYTLLAKEDCDWDHWQIYLGDERCLSIDDTERNSQMIQEILLNNISIPEKNIHFIPAELGPEKAAQLYAAEIKDAIPFDLVMLGMGEDGHTASLFPGHIHDQHELAHAVYDSPKLPSERVSLSKASLSNNHQLLIMTTGKGKKTAVNQWLKGDALPISTISSLGDIKIFLDLTASPE
jgi:6-phosphogluconolactonase